MINLYDFYLNLTKNERVVCRDVLDIRLGWGRSTFYYKVKHQNLTVPEVRELNLLLNDFHPNFKQYVAMVMNFLDEGNLLSRQKCPRRDQKRNNNLISKVYAQLSENNLSSET